MQPMLADVILPTLTILWPPLMLLFVPICVLEAWVLAGQNELPFKSVIWAVAKANFYSATVGFLAMWAGMVILGIGVNVLLALVDAKSHGSEMAGYYFSSLTFMGGRVVDYPHLDELAIATNFIAAYFVSVYFEKQSLKKNLKVLTNDEAWRASWLMNLGSYGLLAVLIAIYLLAVVRGLG
jgi:hypothetical protein